MSLPTYELIDTADAWNKCISVLRKQTRLALDMEANSLYAYRERVCLLQISIPGHDYIIDPLAGFDIAPIGELLAAPDIEKIFHSCEYDLMLLKRHYGWEVTHLFDTMWAGRILGYTNMGLAWFLREFYGVETSKKYQKANWAHRPLSESELLYAQCDTHYLPRLRDDLAAKLEEAGLMKEAREILKNVCHVDGSEREFNPEGFWSLPGARTLPGRAQAILQGLYMFREQEAKRRDVPPFKVLRNETLVALAHHAPDTLKALDNVDGLSARHIQYMGAKLLRVINEGRHAAIPSMRKRQRRHSPIAGNRYKRLMEWRKRAAQERKVESDVILSRDTIWAIADLGPKTADELKAIPSLGEHRRALYGEEILREIADVTEDETV